GEGRTDVAGEGAAFSADGTLAAAGGSVGRVIAFESRRELARVPRRGRACAFAGNGRLLGFGAAIVDTASTGEGPVLAHGGAGTAVAVDARGGRIAAAGADGAVSTWSLPGGDRVAHARTSLSADPAGRLAARVGPQDVTKRATATHPSGRFHATIGDGSAHV